MNVQEIFVPKRMAASGALFGGTGVLGGFLCSTAGTVAVTDKDGTSIVDACTCVSGQFIPMPFACPNGASCVLGGGCIGTFAILA